MPNITIKALEQSINRALAQHDGETFRDDSALEGIFSEAVNEALASEGVTFFNPASWGITVEEARLALYDMQRRTMLQNCERLRDEALAEAARAEADGAWLRALKFE